MINKRIIKKVFTKLNRKEILNKIKEEMVYPKDEKMVLFKENIMGVDVILEDNSYNFALKFKSRECDLLVRYDCHNSICKRFEILVKNDMEIENIPYKEIKDEFINLLEDINEKIYL